MPRPTLPAGTALGAGAEASSPLAGAAASSGMTPGSSLGASVPWEESSADNPSSSVPSADASSWLLSPISPCGSDSAASSEEPGVMPDEAAAPASGEDASAPAPSAVPAGSVGRGIETVGGDEMEETRR